MAFGPFDDITRPITFEEYLEKTKTKIKPDKGKCKRTKPYALSFASKPQIFFNNVTNEDMQRLRVMERYLLRYPHIEQKDFLNELKNKKLKKYYDLLARYPHKNFIITDLTGGAERFARVIDENYTLPKEPKTLRAKGMDRWKIK